MDDMRVGITTKWRLKVGPEISRMILLLLLKALKSAKRTAERKDSEIDINSEIGDLYSWL